MDDALLAQHLYTRARTEPNLDLNEAILADMDKLGSIAGAWRDKKDPISLVIGSKMAQIEAYMVKDMIPMETTVMRQVLAELDGLLELFAKYEAEYTRREKPQPSEDNAETHETTPV